MRASLAALGRRPHELRGQRRLARARAPREQRARAALDAAAEQQSSSRSPLASFSIVAVRVLARDEAREDLEPPRLMM
jgi:hypothetical protein